ncbi:hypothetical protein C2G38_2189627 [Gigaspora rosea]|uniref:Uncharacterized protein n=1 Tax=Gigaspora rosea TaxID=44941 RepID=A0A397V5E2_9GLOM|nr:hypothetical protein C2G38_2189627 [Gigaspora rosea]
MSESISVLTNIIFEQEIIGNDPPMVSFSQLRSITKSKTDQLSFFFNEIEAMACLERKSEAEQKELDRSLAYQYYLMCWNQTFKKDISLFVDLMGVSTEAIDALSHAGITISRRHLDRKKTAIADNHPHKVASDLKSKKSNALVLNVDDYHNIHTKRTPDTCSTSSAAHMTTLLLNGVDMIAIPQVMPNSISIHNPRLIDSELICTFLDNYYIERIAKTFNDQFYYEIPLDEKLENMTLHKYDDRIKERREERKMKDTILLDFFELSLKEMDQYIDALQHVYKIPSLTNYLTYCVIPVVANWPEQLNLLESILKIYWDFFNMEYQYVFSTSKALSKSPSPYRIFVLLELIRGAWKEINPIVLAKVVDAKKTISGFEDVFVDQKKSTYADKDHLALLTKKAEVFLLETFGNIYQRLGQSSIVKGRNEQITYKLASLDITVNKKQMPLGFSSMHLPTYDKCDHCHLLLCDRKDILKLGIRNNVSSFLLQLSKLPGKNKLNLKEIIEADEDSPQNQKISDEDDILEVLQKDKQALPRVEQAYSVALERFLNVNVVDF